MFNIPLYLHWNILNHANGKWICRHCFRGSVAEFGSIKIISIYSKYTCLSKESKKRRKIIFTNLNVQFISYVESTFVYLVISNSSNLLLKLLALSFSLSVSFYTCTLLSIAIGLTIWVFLSLSREQCLASFVEPFPPIFKWNRTRPHFHPHSISHKYIRSLSRTHTRTQTHKYIQTHIDNGTDKWIRHQFSYSFALCDSKY